MQAMSRPTYSAITTYAKNGKPAIVFAPTRKHAKQMATDLMTYAAGDSLPFRFLQVPDEQLAPHLEKISDATLKHALAAGIGILHDTMSEAEQTIVNALFAAGALQVCLPPCPAQPTLIRSISGSNAFLAGSAPVSVRVDSMHSSSLASQLPPVTRAHSTPVRLCPSAHSMSVSGHCGTFSTVVNCVMHSPGAASVPVQCAGRCYGTNSSHTGSLVHRMRCEDTDRRWRSGRAVPGLFTAACALARAPPLTPRCSQRAVHGFTTLDHCTGPLHQTAAPERCLRRFMAARCVAATHRATTEGGTRAAGRRRHGVDVLVDHDQREPHCRDGHSVL